MAQDAPRFEYVINADDVIVDVNPTWKAFAVENHGAHLARTVEGTWLWQHLAGREVKHLYRTLLERVRESGRSVRFPFRCDAPELRRSMMMEVTPAEGGAVGFSSWTLEEVSRPRIDLIAADRDAGSYPLLRMCAWCKRIGEGKDGWRELEEALEDAALFNLDPLPRITHGVCPECQTMILRQAEG